MKTSKYIRNPNDLAVIEQWYERFLDQLQYPTKRHQIDTFAGPTEAIETGLNNHGAPIILLHGAMAGAPFALRELADLPANRRLIAINIPGQSPKAPKCHLSFKNGEYAQFVVQIMESFGLQQADIMGVSWGGSVAIEVCKHAPDKVRSLALVVPGSIVRGSFWQGFTKVGWPIMRYQRTPTQENRAKALSYLCTNEDPLWTPYLGDALRMLIADFRVPPLVKPAQLEALQAPVYVVAADQDVSFPGKKLLARAEKLFPNLIGTTLLAQSKHTPSFHDEDRQKTAQLLERVLEQFDQYIASGIAPGNES